MATNIVDICKLNNKDLIEYTKAVINMASVQQDLLDAQQKAFEAFKEFAKHKENVAIYQYFVDRATTSFETLQDQLVEKYREYKNER